MEEAGLVGDYMSGSATSLHSPGPGPEPLWATEEPLKVQTKKIRHGTSHVGKAQGKVDVWQGVLTSDSKQDFIGQCHP